jgi:Na+-driven multidrug efflux pump
MLIDWKILLAVVKIGVPTGLQVMMVSLAEIVIIGLVNNFGSSATAAYGAVNQIVGYVQFPAISIGISASIFAAQCIGARREDKLGSVIRSAVGLNYAIGGIIIGLCYLFAWQILGWFITDPHTLEIAHGLLMIVLWSYLLFGNSAVLSGVMRGSGTVLWPTINGIFAIWGVELPAAIILMHYFGLRGVWLGYPIAYCVVLTLQFCYYELVWKKKTHERLV